MKTDHVCETDISEQCEQRRKSEELLKRVKCIKVRYKVQEQKFPLGREGSKGDLKQKTQGKLM